MTDKPNGSPWWSRSAWQMGPLAIGFLMLLAAMLGWVPLRHNNGGASAGLEALQRTVTEHAEQSKEMLRVLRKICRHTSQTDAAKEDCDR